MSILTTFDCFCGLGGLSIGGELAGHHVLGGIDSSASAMESFQSTFPKAAAICDDLTGPKAYRSALNAGIKKGDIDVLLGGPPCQAFSVYNHRRSVSDPRALLFYSFLNFASYYRPQWIFIENVPGIISIDNGNFFDRIIKSIRSRGYSLDFKIFNSLDVGVPQKRKRLVLLAHKDSNRVKRVLREVADLKAPPVTVWDAIGDIPASLGDKLRYHSQAMNSFQKMMRCSDIRHVPDHQSMGLGAINHRRLQYIPEGGNWRDLPRRLLPLGMKRARLSDHTTRYGRLDYRKPSHTLLTKPDPHWGCFVHPRRDRVISVREALRLQAIPDKVSPKGTLAEKYKMAGNAVPPLLANEILKRLR